MRRAARCEHGMPPAFCVVRNCAHFDGARTEIQRVRSRRVKRYQCVRCRAKCAPEDYDHERKRCVFECEPAGSAKVRTGERDRRTA